MDETAPRRPVRLRRRILRTLALAVVAWWVVTGAVALMFEDRFIYFPEKKGVGPSPGEDVFLTTGDGVRLHGWYVTHPDAKFTLLWLHGNAGNIEYRRDMLANLQALPANVLLIDYRGYGKSEGTPGEKGLYRDADAAYEWLRSRTSEEKIVIFGKSLGGAPACNLALRSKCGGLIVQSAFTSARAMAWRVFPFSPAPLLMKSKFDNLGIVGRIGCPKLFLHSRQDEIIPFSMGEKLFAAAAEPKERAWFDTGGHNDLWSVHPKEYYACLARFLKSLEK